MRQARAKPGMIYLALLTPFAFNNRPQRFNQESLRLSGFVVGDYLRGVLLRSGYPYKFITIVDAPMVYKIKAFTAYAPFFFI
jgi:hypothetical protein